MRLALWDRLRAKVADWAVPPVQISVFGSAARGDGELASDIDLLVVRPDALDPEDGRWRAQVAELADRVEAWTGNHASVAEVAAGAMPRLQRDRPALARNLRADAIALAGPDVAALLESTA
jgi:predicted nucleotidyltransferase